MNATAQGKPSQRHEGRRLALLFGVGLSMAVVFAVERRNSAHDIVAFELAFFTAFVLYAAAVLFVLHRPTSRTPWPLILVFAFGLIFRLILITSQPKLSDDMYRYVWDGRVQAHQINPYAYPPGAKSLSSLRDSKIWPLINRKDAVTVYPAGAEVAFALIWRIWPDNIHWFQFVMTAGDLLAGFLLLYLLRALKRPTLLVVIYLWSPLVIFETAHAAHVDGLVLPLLVAAWLARAQRRDAWTGLLLGLAASIKLYPLLLFPALWRSRDEAGSLRPLWVMPLTLLIGFGLPYLPYLSQGIEVIGYLPHYFTENFNIGLAHFVLRWAAQAGLDPSKSANLFMACVLALISLVLILRPASSPATAIRRCIWPIGAFTLLTQNLFPWYMLWLVPLLAIYLRPGRLLGFEAGAWTGWWLFSGLIGLAYTFFIRWVPVPAAIWAQFIPLYIFLLLDLIRYLWNTTLPNFKSKTAGLLSN